MYCKYCGKQIEDDAIFCPFCGSKLSEKAADDSKRKVVFDGEIHKCPNCGETLKAFETVCPSCGYELRGSKGGRNRVEELSEKLEKATTSAQRYELINSFYIPNTKEDICEFFILAVSTSDDSYCNEAWNNKLEQAYIKAKLSFGNTDEFAYIHSLYKKAIKVKKSSKKAKAFVKIIRVVGGLIVALAGLLMMVIAGVLAGKSGDPDDPLYMVSIMGYMPFFGGIGLLAWGITQNVKDRKEERKNSQRNK